MNKSRIQSDTRLKWIEQQGQQLQDYANSVQAQIWCLQDLANQLMNENDELRDELKKRAE